MTPDISAFSSYVYSCCGLAKTLQLLYHVKALLFVPNIFGTWYLPIEQGPDNTGLPTKK